MDEPPLILPWPLDRPLPSELSGTGHRRSSSGRSRRVRFARRATVADSWAAEEARACSNKAWVPLAVGVVQPRRDFGVKIAAELLGGGSIALIGVGA